MYWISKAIHRFIRFKRRVAIVLAVVGPGIITLVADNDAGGISTYAVTGSKYGFNLLWIFIFLIPAAYFIQEMTVRLGAVTKRGHAEAIFDSFGPFWGWFSLFDLAIVNWLTLITEYIGMIAAMELFAIPPIITFVLVTLLLIGITVTGSYWTFEKITLLFCGFNLVYIPAALWAMKLPDAPGWDQVLKGFYAPSFPGGFSGDLIFFIMANIGTTITGWQIFFQQSAVVDKGLETHDVNFGRIDTLVGAILTGVVAIFIIITTAAAFHYHNPPIVISDAKQTAEALVPLFPYGRGELAKRLFAIGLFDAGFLGALCISLTTSWSVGEVFGWAHSLNRRVKEAPWFYFIYIFGLVSAGAITLIPGAPLIIITMFVQVIAVTLLPSALIFLGFLLNDKELMGQYTNTRLQNFVNWSIIIIIFIMATIFALTVLFPEMFNVSPGAGL
ncbi:MAG: Divalent metal cation transporter MntH [candidate division TA06 bacterium ADurb.Bin131]|uniref:Divalent metal cation transporter MntH n=1 Tax=candidate division TA06 bacterium ADurb.Bin131 TaxID=1852827 RepID=A0A1V6C7K2_UNCT6|nr:MAG: Divalent metal cation transporter MntH [candidate division TA06 bacterium ADurb.Bin131]HON06234.1 divalent metal cation transporter [bacterium]